MSLNRKLAMQWSGRRLSGAPRSQDVKMSIGFLSPFKLLAHRTCGIFLKTPSFSVFCINCCHSLVWIHCFQAHLFLKLASNNTSCISSRVVPLGGPGGGISTGMLSKRVTYGLTSAWRCTSESSVSRRWTDVEGLRPSISDPAAFLVSRFLVIWDAKKNIMQARGLVLSSREPWLSVGRVSIGVPVSPCFLILSNIILDSLMIYVLESMKLSRQRMDSAYQAANSRRSQHTSF